MIWEREVRVHVCLPLQGEVGFILFYFVFVFVFTEDGPNRGDPPPPYSCGDYTQRWFQSFFLLIFGSERRPFP